MIHIYIYISYYTYIIYLIYIYIYHILFIYIYHIFDIYIYIIFIYIYISYIWYICEYHIYIYIYIIYYIYVSITYIYRGIIEVFKGLVVVGCSVTTCHWRTIHPWPCRSSPVARQGIRWAASGKRSTCPRPQASPARRRRTFTATCPLRMLRKQLPREDPTRFKRFIAIEVPLVLMSGEKRWLVTGSK